MTIGSSIQRDIKDNQRIPGAQEWSSNGIDRIDGPLLSGNMVLDGETMDTMMQERGVREGSTIVFCGSDKSQASRVYFFFRYWGFPKERLVFLDGGFPAWQAANAEDPDSYPITTLLPTVEPSTFSVADIPGGPDLEVRASLSEAIIGVEQGTVQPYSTLPNTASMEPKTTETLADDSGINGVGASTGGYVLFQGELSGNLANDEAGQALLQPAVTINGVDVKYYLTAEQMRTYLEGLGYDLTKPIMTYCRAGNYASYGFGPIDAVLGRAGVKAMLYDGSYSQWGSLSTSELANTYIDSDNESVQLPYLLPNPNSPDGMDYSAWATDVLTDQLYYLVNFAGEPWKDTNNDNIIDYNDTLFDPEEHIQRPYFFVAPESPYDPGANTIEDADYKYWKDGGEAVAPGPVSGATVGC